MTMSGRSAAEGADEPLDDALLAPARERVGGGLGEAEIVHRVVRPVAEPGDRGVERRAPPPPSRGCARLRAHRPAPGRWRSARPRLASRRRRRRASRSRSAGPPAGRSCSSSGCAPVLMTVRTLRRRPSARREAEEGGVALLPGDHGRGPRAWRLLTARMRGGRHPSTVPTCAGKSARRAKNRLDRARVRELTLLTRQSPAQIEAPPAACRATLPASHAHQPTQGDPHAPVRSHAVRPRGRVRPSRGPAPPRPSRSSTGSTSSTRASRRWTS